MEYKNTHETNNMPIKTLIFVTMIALGFGFAYWDQTKTPPLAPVTADSTHKFSSIIPNATFQTTTDETFDLHDFKGKTIILNFWATWCVPCIKEFPELLDLAEAHPDQLVFIALSVDEDPAKVMPFFERFDQEVRNKLSRENVVIGYDTDKEISQDLFQTVRFPETYIIGPDLKIITKIVGLTDWTSSEIAAFISP